MASRKEIERSVAEIIREVRERGDVALVEFARRWDGASLRPEDLRVPREAIQAADDSTEFAAAFRRAAERIRRFHEAVKPRSISVEDPEGVRMGLRWTPLSSAGLYIPGGKASYPSSLAMTAIPAQVAGVKRIAVVSPCGPGGEVCPEVLLAAKVLGLDEIYRTGGAQAVAALALGTGQIPRVDKIFGPGNAYVTEAKRQLYGVVGIDLLAGPSEIVVYADLSANPEWVAADLIAQAEHDASARPIVIADSEAVLRRIREALERRIEREPRKETIRASLRENGVFLVAPTPEEAAARIDEIAPEHLSIQAEDPRAILARVSHAGAIYLGGPSAVALGDYYAGPNHVLPTGGAARYASSLSVEDFMKRSNVVESTAGFIRLRGADVVTLAEGEGLSGHAASVSARLEFSRGARAGLASTPAYHLVDEDAEVKLNQNESPWDIPLEIKDRILTTFRELPWHRYPQRIPDEFRRKIASTEGFPEEGVRVGNGSNLILQWILEAYGGPGRLALIPRPSFSLFKMWCGISETNFEEYALGDLFEYPVEEVVRRIRDLAPALTILCLPNNPTGSDLLPEEVTSIAKAARDTGGLLVIDEAYREFAEKEYDRTALARNQENVILVRTYSKAFAGAGLRIGYLLTSERTGAELGKIIPPFHLSLFAAVAGSILWDQRELFQERVARIVAERNRMQKALREIRGVEVFPSQANFFLLSVPEAQEVFHSLGEREILVREPGGDRALEGCLRVNAGDPEENNRFIEAMREIIPEVTRRGK